MEPFEADKYLVMVERTEDNYLREVKPELTNVKGGDLWLRQIDHFVDCCTKGTECICKIDEAVVLMEIIDAIYKSAEINQPVIF